MKTETVERLNNSLTDSDVLAKLSKLPLKARGIVEGTFSGIHKSPNKGSSVEFSQYRKYVHGDDISTLDWKVLARTDRYYVKEFEADTNMRCHVVIDCSKSMAFPNEKDGKLSQAIKMAFTIAQIAVLQGDAVGLQCFSEKIIQDIPARNNPGHIKNIREILLAMKAEGKTDIVTVLHNMAEKIRRRAMIILFSDLFTEDVDRLLDCFQHMKHRKHDLAVFHLIAKEELDFEFDRPVRFKDLEMQSVLLAEPAQIKQFYLSELDKYLKKIRTACAEFNVDYRFADTSIHYAEHLKNFMLDRMRRK
jgi:uncharacterized protein (DUF58 family)